MNSQARFTLRGRNPDVLTCIANLSNDEVFISPAFVRGIGKTFDEDDAYFCGDDNENSHYVFAGPKGIEVIGELVDEDVCNFKAEMPGYPGVADDLPRWLDPYPIQQLLKLTTDTSMGTAFALSRRVFPKDLRSRRIGWGVGDSETIFRPAFADPVSCHTPPVRQNTVGAYLLRNFVEADPSGIFGALKSDAKAKASAARDLVQQKSASFRDAFDERYR